MVRVYTDIEYSKAYTELLEILKHFPDEEYKKIPKKIIDRYGREKDIGYAYKYNTEIGMEEQNISQLTKILLANLYIDYIASEQERNIIRKKDRIELDIIEKEKNEKYNIENIFEERKQKIKQNDIEIEKSLIVISENKNIFAKIIDKIKILLKLT